MLQFGLRPISTTHATREPDVPHDIVLIVILNEQGDYLMTEDERGRNFVFVGGRMYPGDKTPRDAAFRVLKAKTGIVPSVLRRCADLPRVEGGMLYAYAACAEFGARFIRPANSPRPLYVVKNRMFPEVRKKLPIRQQTVLEAVEQDLKTPAEG